MPVAQIQDEIAKGQGLLFSLIGGDELAGFAFYETAPKDNLTLLAYLAIDAKYQGKGEGLHLLKRSLQMLTQAYPHTQIALECKDHLLGFYKKAGFIKATASHVVPGYKSTEMLRYNLLTLSSRDLHNLSQRIISAFYGA